MADDFAYLTGPNLVVRANEIIQGLNGEKLSSLYITKVFGKHAEIHRALTLLRGHFNQNAIIYVSESQELPAVSNQTIKMIESASGVKVRYGGSTGQMKLVTKIIPALTGGP